MNIEEFYTRDKANEGRKMTLKTPDGKETTEWLHVVGADSDAYEEALIELSSQTGDRKTLVNKLYPKLVKAWSFDKPITEAAVEELFKNAPYIRRAVISFVDDVESFFGKSGSV
jgi:hypothetical protein